MKVQRGQQIMDTRNAAGARGRLERRDNGQWRFFEAGAAQPVAGYLVVHDDLAFTTAQGRAGMLLSGMDGMFIVDRGAAQVDEWPGTLEITIDGDELACFYAAGDEQSQWLLDHSPQVLGLATA